MKISGYLIVVLVLSMVAANVGHAAPGAAPKNGGRPDAPGKAAAPAGHATPGQAPTSGASSASGKTGRQGPGGGQVVQA